MSNFSFHNQIYEKLNDFIEKNNIPHIIFHGNSGTGKRTIVNNFITRIYKYDKQKIKSNVLFVNCAHGKGIKFIREELKFFAKTNIQTNNGMFFKSIVLSNAGYLTMDAQSALRRCIEQFSYNTRFFIIIEDKNKLLNPILSRFCEIYIPEYVNENNEVINLHKHFIEDKHNLEKEVNYSELIGEKLNNIDKTHANFIELVEDFYNDGISCLDLVKFIKESDEINELDKIRTGICFDTINSQFRNEKILMFFILDYLYIRSNKDLKCISVL